LIKAVQSAEGQYGESSAEYATANYELGSMLNLMERHADAAKALAKAIDVNIPDDHQATRDRLTYMMQLGGLYDQMGQWPEAEKVLRKGLRLREDFYGKDHAGYAFGLEPLASVLMNQGNLGEALRLIEETIDNFWMNGHPRVATAFPLRAMILKKRRRRA
jgi:tetratricopeptide (TPR) repeat protein